MKIRKLEWDSDFFGFSVGRLDYEGATNLSTFLQNNNNNPYHLVYLFSKTPLPKEEQESLSPMGTKLVFSKQLTQQFIELSPNIESYTAENVSDKLLDLAYQSGIYSRFRLDPKMPTGSFEKLYRLWIERSVDRSLAKEVYVYKMGDIIAGMITIGVKNGRGEIGLIAVDKTFRGQSIGSKLLASADAFCLKHQLEFLDVATQKENNPAAQFYSGKGFEVAKEDYIYHYWNKEKL